MLNTEVTEFLHASLCHCSSSLLSCFSAMPGCWDALCCKWDNFSQEVGFPQCSADIRRGQGGLNTTPFRTKSSATNRTSNSESHLDNIFFVKCPNSSDFTVFISCFIIREHRGNL